MYFLTGHIYFHTSKLAPHHYNAIVGEISDKQLHNTIKFSISNISVVQEVEISISVKCLHNVVLETINTSATCCQV